MPAVHQYGNRFERGSLCHRQGTCGLPDTPHRLRKPPPGNYIPPALNNCRKTMGLGSRVQKNGTVAGQVYKGQETAPVHQVWKLRPEIPDTKPLERSLLIQETF